VKKVYKILKNKYVISTVLVLFYILLLHNTDLASLNKRKERVEGLKLEMNQKRKKIKELKISLHEIENVNSLEKFAREKYYFKRNDEDIFILSDK